MTRQARSFFVVIPLALCLAMTFSGCLIAAPFIDAFKKMGATESDRQELLQARLKHFADALYWGKGEAQLFVDESAPDELKRSLSTIRENQRVVESKIRSVVYRDGATEADADVVVRYYKVPYYVVQNRYERQTWKFSHTSGWLLFGRQILPAPEPEEADE
jgi:hypothetical protein